MHWFSKFLQFSNKFDLNNGILDEKYNFSNFWHLCICIWDTLTRQLPVKNTHLFYFTILHLKRINYIVLCILNNFKKFYSFQFQASWWSYIQVLSWGRGPHSRYLGFSLGPRRCTERSVSRSEQPPAASTQASVIWELFTEKALWPDWKKYV